MRQKFFILLPLLIAACISRSQTLYISPASNVFISGGAIFSTDSLVLIPSSNFNISGENAETKNASIINASSNPYVKRVYHFLNTTAPYSGSITIYYLDAELNGIAENVLTLNIHNGTAWNAYTTGAIRDGVNNFVTTTGLTNISLNELTLAALAAPLPIKFTQFTTACTTAGVILNWKTAQEQNAKNFEVQQSADGLSWKAIASITAAGNSNTERSYTYIDSNSIANNYYRIIGYDVNGKTTIGLTLRSNCSTNDVFAVYPNPVKDAALVTVKVNTATKLNLSLYDAKGALVKTMQVSLLPGSNQVPLHIATLPNGWYHLTAKWGNTVKKLALIKQ